MLLQNVTAILLQNATEGYYKMLQKVITKCVRFFITKWNSFVARCNDFITDSYYKIQHLLQTATVQWLKMCSNGRYLTKTRKL